MTDMIEKMAHAIHRARISAYSNVSSDWDLVKDSAKARYREQAKAALTALEQPSDEMVQTGITYRLAVEKPNMHDTAGIFSAMIKAARGDQ